MQEKIIQFAEFNGINVLAISISVQDVEGILSVLVLTSAFAYNIKKLTSRNNGKD